MMEQQKTILSKNMFSFLPSAKAIVEKWKATDFFKSCFIQFSYIQSYFEKHEKEEEDKKLVPKV